MALTVNTNVSALNAQRSTLDSQNEMASAMERLASGKRINSAVDDAAGIAIAARMESQISGLNQAVRNANDAISLVQTAEGALQETTSILQRIRELSIQSAGGAPSNADRVNLNKEVVQLQEELSRIANTTRFNGGLLLNGTFLDTDFQIGQSNNEEITISIGDIRPERIGAFTQSTVSNVGLVTSGAALDEIDNGVNQQTLIVQVGNEVPRTIAVKQGDDARTISDKLNQAGAQVNTTATNNTDVYVSGAGTFTFKISSSSTPDIQDVVIVGATAGSQPATLAAEINRGYSEHNISATLEVDDDGVEYVNLIQNDGYDILIEEYVTTGTSTIDFDSDGVAELTGAYGKTAVAIGGSVTIDAPASFLISSDDASNTVLAGTRAALEVIGVENDPAEYQNKTFDVTVNGVTQSISLAAPPPAEPRPATAAVAAMEFTATAQTQGGSSAQIGAVRASTLPATAIDTTLTVARGSADLQFSLNVNGGGAQDLDMADALSDLGYSSGDDVSAADFITAMQTTINGNAYFTNDNAVTVTRTDYGQVSLAVAGGAGTITVAEHSSQSAGISETIDLDADITAATDTIAVGGHAFYTGQAVVFTDGTDGATSDSTLVAGTYYAIVVDANTIQLASTEANALAGTEFVITGDGDHTDATLTVAATDGLAATLITNAAPSDGSSTESASDGALTLGETINDAADSVYGPVNPLGIPNRTINTSNDTFTLAINGGAPTTIDVADGTYYGMSDLAVAVQAAIDDSPFAQTGSFPIVVTPTQDTNGDWGLTFASADGHSINLGGTEFLTDSSGLGVSVASTAPGLDAFEARTITIAAIDSGLDGTVDDPDDETTSLAVNVNGGGLIDIELGSHLLTAGVTGTATTVSEDLFIEAFQAALDAEDYLSGDNAVTVSVTDAGLVQLTVAGGAGTITVAEHSSYAGLGVTSGLAETLTGTVANASDLSNGLTTSEATQTGTGGSIILGSTANTANGDATDSNYVKSFGIAPLVITAGTSDTLTISINGGAATSLTIPAGTYLNMDAIATAVSSEIASSPQLAGSLTVSSVQDSADDSWGLTFASPSGFSVDVYGDFVSGSLASSVTTGAATIVTDSFSISGHGLNTGDAVLYSDGTTAATGLTDATTYYVIAVDADTISLATTQALALAGTAITLTGTGSADQSISLTSHYVAEVGTAPSGPAAYRSTVAAGSYSDGIDLSVDNTVTVEVIDNETGVISTQAITLDSSSSSVSFADYMTSLEAAATAAFTSEGFTFASSGSGTTYAMTFAPAGNYTVSFSGDSVTQAFGAPVTATGQASNTDGLTFTSMDDVVAELNAQLAANDVAMSATYSRGGDTFLFTVTGGPADSTSAITLSGDDLVSLGFTGTLEAVGGGTHKSEDVRYVSQIDISTRESALMAMTVVDAALETMAGVRGGLGAVANRLESTISNLMNISENTSASMSRVMDADFAAESTRLARAQVLQQASVAMLAQANASAQNVLKLLQ